MLAAFNQSRLLKDDLIQANRTNPSPERLLQRRRPMNLLLLPGHADGLKVEIQSIPVESRNPRKSFQSRYLQQISGRERKTRERLEALNRRQHHRSENRPMKTRFRYDRGLSSSTEYGTRFAESEHITFSTGASADLEPAALLDAPSIGRKRDALVGGGGGGRGGRREEGARSAVTRHRRLQRTASRWARSPGGRSDAAGAFIGGGGGR